jgi:hypothetical protein
LGIPGSAYVAGAVLENVDAVAVSPDGAALASHDGALVLISRAADGNFEVGRVEDSVAAALLAWSPDGSAAVAYSPEQRMAQVLTRGKAVRVIDLSTVDGVSAVAIDDTGDQVLIGAHDGLHFARKSGDVTRIAAIATPAAIALKGGDAFVAANGIFEIQDYSGKAALLAFADETDVLGLQVARDEKRLIVAASRTLSVYDVASRTVTARLDLEFPPTMLARLGAGSVFALNSATAGVEPLYIFDAGREPSVFFVPAGREQ